MPDFILKHLPYNPSGQADLALTGKYLQRINLTSLVDPRFPVRSSIANSDILKSYLGLLCLGKNDLDAIEGQRKAAALFARALGWALGPCHPRIAMRSDRREAACGRAKTFEGGIEGQFERELADENRMEGGLSGGALRSRIQGKCSELLSDQLKLFDSHRKQIRPTKQHVSINM